MGKVIHFDKITGKVGNLSFYTRKGSDKVFVRTSGGPTKEQIKRRPEFGNVRKNNKEFGGCSRMSKEIRMTFRGLQHVADYNLAPALCSLMKNIQISDLEGIHGERRIQLSKYRQFLTGFNLNRITLFDSTVRVQLVHKIDREAKTATIEIPSFSYKIGLNLPFKQQFFRFSGTLGVVCDHRLSDNKFQYEPVSIASNIERQMVNGSWFPVKTTVPAQQLTFDLNQQNNPVNLNEPDTLILTVALEFGEPDPFGSLVPVKGAGTGKIIEVK